MNYSGGDKKREAKKYIMENLLFNVKKINLIKMPLTMLLLIN